MFFVKKSKIVQKIADSAKNSRATGVDVGQNIHRYEAFHIVTK
jgi:hypothetical protein